MVDARGDQRGDLALVQDVEHVRPIVLDTAEAAPVFAGHQHVEDPGTAVAVLGEQRRVVQLVPRVDDGVPQDA